MRAPAHLYSDMLRIVFQNLLINSAHAMHDRGTIRVAVETRNGTCQIAFIDGGPGIPLEIREKVFTPSSRRNLVDPHDGPDEWGRMIEHLHRAEEQPGRSCRILMALAGPRVCTADLLSRSIRHEVQAATRPVRARHRAGTRVAVSGGPTAAFA